MANFEELSPANLQEISRIEYRWGGSFRVFTKNNTEIDLGIPDRIMRALLKENGAAVAEAFAIMIAKASGKTLDPAYVDRDHSFPYHARCTTFWFLKKR